MCDIRHRTADMSLIHSCCSRQSAAFRTVRLEVRSVCTIALFLAAISTIPTEVLGQQPRLRSGIDVSHEPIFLSQRLLVASGKIFSGTVLQIEHRNPDSSSALATTRVVFRVDEAIRNVRRGQILEVDEWAGLWQSGERYRPG